MDTFIATLPIIFLVWSMTKVRPWPSYIALPVTALLVGVLQLFYFHGNQTELAANAVAGLLSVLTPMSIVAGAILLNSVLVLSGSQEKLRLFLENVSNNKVAQLMIIGWAFTFMLEGASGFGTPAAIAAPILVGLGFPALRVALLTLVMNTVPVSFGAVGTPTWFGFEALNLSEETLLEVSSITASMHFVAALVIPVMALKFLVSWSDIRANALFILLSIISCTAPYLLLAQVNYEFPALIGGAIGLALSIVFAKRGLGLKRVDNDHEVSTADISFQNILKATFPFILLITILVVTRVQQLEIKPLLNDTALWFQIFHIEVSRALIVSWSHIFGTTISWSYKTLYVPALIPFVVTIILLIPLFSLPFFKLRQALSETGERIKKPTIALAGALIMVNFMMQGNAEAPMFIIANSLANATGDNWLYVASLLGALGSFFSGSATISNLTFGGIQYGIAEQAQLPVPLVLSLQSVGAAMGNMICINNIIAVSAILGIKNQEGKMIKRTIAPMLVYALIAGLLSQLLIFA
ncbi:L-lactate permease [Alteromonas sp. A081]|uniref:L-lactate permease n=1 Tax=Alteromonas sp. A081 TaxID=3410269 RepID=UPI003B97F14C